MTGDDYLDPSRLEARIAIHRYGTNPQSWYDFVRERLPLARGERVLDAGAGTGLLWDYDHGARLTLLDRSPSMRHHVRGDVVALPFADGAFDGAVCHHVLYHAERPADALRELRRVSRGWVTVATNGRGHMHGLGEDVHTHFPAERLGEAMAEHFDEVTLHPYEDTLVAPVEAVRAYVASVGVDPATVTGEGPVTIAKHTVLAVAR
ncbi:MAG TPA: class I SAM-dependent methyltransferase [Frankiaceae bacterium]|nr:class I SAM-dependent methyltransferase [Frankiaceae bacterium]